MHVASLIDNNIFYPRCYCNIAIINFVYVYFRLIHGFFYQSSSMWPTMEVAFRRNIKIQRHVHVYMLFTTSAASTPAIKPDEGGSIPLHTDAYASLLQACTHIESLRQLHANIFANGQSQNVFLVTKLVGIYAVFGFSEDARKVFDKTCQRNIFVWNEMIKGYACNGLCEEALSLYCQMQQAGVQPNRFTIPFVLKACAGLSALQRGMEIHAEITRRRLDSNVCVENALVDMYAKCQRMDIARDLFDKMSQRDVVSWTTMISRYAQNGHANEALALFHQMKLTGMRPNRVTILSVLPAYAELGNLQEGKGIHEYIIENKLELDVSMRTCLITMYAKCGSVKYARQLFDKTPKRDVVLWSAMIATYAQTGHANEALMLFKQMQQAGVKPSSFTIVSVLQACAHLGVLQQGIWIHDYSVRSGMELNVFVGTALIDMYAKCGNITMARQLFDRMSKRNVVSWSAMIAGYGMHGLGKDAVMIFTQMLHASMKPNHITFICVLSACSHAGLVDEGWQYFHSMRQDYCITPRLEHYTCMVDLLGRAGKLDEAQDFVQNMPFKPDVGVWGALLGACRIYCNIELGRFVAEHLFNLEPENVGYYVLLSNIYAAAGRWEDVEKVRQVMKYITVNKMPGCSWIEINKQRFAFVGGDTSRDLCTTLTHTGDKRGDL
jgi:pentatricopeptide repeat protein